MKVRQMTTCRGGLANNQFIIKGVIYEGKEGSYFQSYDSIIAFKGYDGTLILDSDTWNYSSTTAQYRNKFTGLPTKETERQIKSGTITLADLNK